MLSFKPFKAIRPTRDKAYLVATRSYVTYSKEALEDKLSNNPYTFLHVINPDEARIHNLQGSEKYKVVRKTFEKFIDEGIFFTEAKKCFYLYRQSTQEHIFTGIIGAVSVADYEEGRVKIHEHTLSKREEMFADYLYHTGFNAEPVLLTYPWQSSLHKVFERYLLIRPEYEFTSTDRVLHELWIIDDINSLESIEMTFAQIDAVYIADGHHRSASSALLHKKLVNEKNATPESAYFMAMMLPDTELVVDSFYRLLENNSDEEKNKILDFIFSNCERMSDNWVTNRGYISIFYGAEWQTFKFPEHWYEKKNLMQQLDASILFDHILNPIAGVESAKENSRLHYMPAPEGRDKAREWVLNHKNSIAFEIAPVNFETVKRIADAHLVMPPKSTFILPKLRSGLTIYDLGLYWH
ncbi:DUF1015 domain-containing protein [Schleiferia thermophila]|jgi:uncharacterized protein (DUF1015 family)|uniref:DUF1015 domain-containing protein n=1 Tax=Schleiferia thermophila TaxID=884107 RepID=UPI0004E74262|nr:DUF1015 domain-containing protein [Schleiferia thermophila]KFD39008.1 hypothetical protein AT05_06750 [Schleiferia thermophila str. Yellowstone]PMB25520.1 DUF1015 domain-containing protein [Fischerella thermalis CCMEE 5319]